MGMSMTMTCVLVPAAVHTASADAERSKQREHGAPTGIWRSEVRPL
jgi:hypothetical protein